MIFGFNPTKCKTQCRLGVGRIKLLRNKKTVAMKSLRREVAELLRAGKQGNARIRVEAVMREQRMLQAFEILELYLELLAVRAELLSKNKEIPPDMAEAICSLIYAGERVATDLAEIAVVSKMLVSKYGSVYKPSGFPEEVVSDLTCRKWQVNDVLVECLAVAAPLPEKKLEALAGIAEEHGVEFDRDAAALDLLPAAGQPRTAAAYAAAADPLPPGGAGVPQPPPLAQGWQPPAGPAPPPPPSAVQPKGWHPPGKAAPGEGDAAAAAAAAHLQRVLSGGTVVVRNVAPGAAWAPPAPDDPNQAGRTLQTHIGSAAAWRKVRLHGPTPSASGSSEPSQGSGEVPYPPPATAAAGPPADGADGDTCSSSTPAEDKPRTPSGSYEDASAAAEAARRYSEMAAAAAQRAEEFAAGQASGRPGDDGKGAPGSPGAGGGGGGGGGSGFVPRSLSSVQRAYDAAPGPPAKGQVEPPQPPSAPPAAAPAASPARAAAAQPGEDAAPELDLPSVPTSGSVPPPAPAVQEELDELTKRFEMLKRR